MILVRYDRIHILRFRRLWLHDFVLSHLRGRHDVLALRIGSRLVDSIYVFIDVALGI